MNAVLIALNITAGLFLIGVVLLQSGKGADMGAAFGGASSTVFGPSGAGSALSKVTVATAIVFMGTSLALAILSGRQHSVVDTMGEPTRSPAPIAAPIQPTPGADETASNSPESSDAMREAAAAAQAAVDGASGVAGQATDEAANAMNAASDAVNEAATQAANAASAATEAAQDAAGAADSAAAKAASAASAATEKPAAAASSAAAAAGNAADDAAKAAAPAVDDAGKEN